MTRFRPALAAFALLLAGFCSIRPAQAATRVVTSLIDFPLAGVLSLREAIAQSAPGDTIRFATTGTIRLTQGPLSPAVGVTIEGPGADKLTINGNNNGNVFVIPQSTTVQISDLTITNGTTSFGIGLTMGAGINNAGFLTLTRCSIVGNHAVPPPNSAGMLNYRGGGISNSAVLHIQNCDISSNSAEVGGGIDNFGLLDIRNSTVSNNQATTGAGINSISSALVAIGSTISGNIATGSGGGLYLQSSQQNQMPAPPDASLLNCTLSGNVAQSGGGLQAQTIIVFVGSSTITDNDATVGGGIFNAGEVRAASTIVAGNAAGVGPDWSGTAFSEGSNLIGDTSGVVSNTNPNFVPGFGDFNYTPGLNDLLDVDAKLGPLNANGGPTRTHLPLVGSPAIDRAIVGQSLQTQYATYSITTDQRGLPRFADGNGDGTILPDVGAVEVQSPTVDLNGSANGNDYIAGFTEDGGPTAIVDTTGLTVANPGGTTLASATVKLTNRPDGNLESLSATPSGGISVLYNPASGELSLNGTATTAAYETVLRSVKYNNLSQDPDTTTRLITFVAFNGSANGMQATSAVSISAVNDAPVNTVPGAQSTDEDTALVFSTGNNNLISLNDVDAGSNALEVALSVTNGTLSLGGTTGLVFSSGDGSDDATMTFTGTLINLNTALAGLKFTPASNANGGATLTVTTNDQGNTGGGGAQTATSTVAISIGAVNDAPVNSVPGAQTTSEDTPLIFSTANGNLVSIADSDVASNTLLVTLTATHGTLTLSTTTGLSFLTGDGSADRTMSFGGSLAAVNAALSGLSFTPDANYNGPATLTVLSNDGGNAGAGGPRSDSDDVAITVAPVNDPPSATDDTYTVNGTGAFTVAAPGVLSNDSDIESDALTAIKVTDPAHGSLTLNNDGSFIYTPQSDFNGADSFSYRVNDGSLDSLVATVTLNVEGNTSPAVSFVFPTANAVLNRLPRINGVTSDRRNTVELVIQRRSDRKYFDGVSFVTNQVRLPATVLADGRWILPGGLLPASEDLQDGSYIFTAIASDVIGATATQTIVIILDRQSPMVGIANPGPAARLTALKVMNGPLQDPAGGGGLERVIVELRRLSDGFYWTGTQWTRTPTGLRTVVRGFTWAYPGPFPSDDDLRTGGYRLQVTAIDRAGNRGFAQNTFSIVTPGSANVSPLRLSGAAVQAQRGVVLLRFGGPLNASSAIALANYAVSVSGVAVAVEGVTYDAATSLVTVQLADDSVSPGDVLVVRYNLRDAAGRVLTGQVGLTAR